jgi:hypothetical protein
LKSRTHEERTLNRCKTLAIAGLYSKAVKALMRSEPNGVDDEAKLGILRKLHPKRVEVIEKCVLEAPVEVKVPSKHARSDAPEGRQAPKKPSKPVHEPPLKTYVRSLCHGKSSGVSGWTEELIREAFDELPFQQLGSRIRQCLADAVDRSRLG